MDAGRFTLFNGAPGGLDLVRFETGKRANLHVPQFLCQELHCPEVAGGGAGEAGLENVDTEAFQLLTQI